ncbi:MAG: DUF378 domain-containing protein [Bauldia sp.]
MKWLNVVSLILVIVGAINWGLVGLFNGWNLVEVIFQPGSAITKIIYIVVGLSGLYQIMSLSKMMQSDMA